MELVQARIVTGDVERLAAFYARLVDTPVTLNEYYVEVPAGAVTVGFSHRRFTECPGGPATSSAGRMFSAGNVPAVRSASMLGQRQIRAAVGIGIAAHGRASAGGET